MKKEYDLKKLKKRRAPVVTDSAAAKTAISIRLDSADLADLKSEAHRLGIPYQTLIGSILHRYANGEIVDKNSPDLRKLISKVK